MLLINYAEAATDSQLCYYYLKTMDERLNPETHKRFVSCVCIILLLRYARVVQSGAHLLISHHKDWTGKRKFKSTSLAKMFAGRRKFFRGPHVRHLWYKI